MGAAVAVPIALAVTLWSQWPAKLVHCYKWLVSLACIRLHRRIERSRFDLYDTEAEDDPEKIGFLVPRGEFNLESPLPEEQLENAVDEMFCYGVNSKGERLIVRVVRGTNHKAESWIHLHLANGKTYELTETAGYQQSSGDKSFTCGGLRFHNMSPMRRWRIFYSGWLKETTDGNASEKMVFVKFSYIWRAASNVYDVTSDINERCLANALADAKWKFPYFLPPLEKLHSSLDFYAQAGIIMGSATIEDDDDHEMYMFGERIRFRCSTSDQNKTEFVHLLGNMPKNGSFLHLGQVSMENVVENLVIGVFILPTSDVKTIEDMKPALVYEHLKSDLVKNIATCFRAGNLHEIKISKLGLPKQFDNALGWNGTLTFHNVQLEMDDYIGGGVLISGKVFQVPKETTQKKLRTIRKEVPLVVHFSDEMSHNEEVSGGKGSSLGKLTHLSQDNSFIVPKGVIVTTSAYEKFLTAHMLDEIKILESVVYGGSSSEEIKMACEKMTRVVVQSSLPDKLCHSIETHLAQMYEANVNAYRFAVRSSATGEDTEQMSAAGQMDTFLGVQGLKEIFTAVKKCWASQFGFVAVEYKRQNGQHLNCPMAVVIQEMVACETAGVLFTCDPVTGNLSTISITANYGLGESVVSGAEEPDTITLKRDFNGQLKIESSVVGSKRRRVVMKDDGEVHFEDVPENMSHKCSLSNKQALHLARLGIRIEKHYRSCRDIEWGISDGKFYILQSRPVTSGTDETEYEIKHELDAPIRCENDYFTVCNVGEVMPGATSPLGIDVLLKYFGAVFQKRSFQKLEGNTFFKNRYFPSGIVPFYNHVMLTVIDMIFRLGNTSASTMNQGTMIGIFGRVLDDPDMFAAAHDRFRYVQAVKKTGFRSVIRIIRDLFFAGSTLDSLKREIENYSIPIENYKTSQELFHAATHHCTKLFEPFIRHIMCTESSSLWNIILFSLLGKAKGGFDTDVYSDFARLLATCSNVESADVPSAMQDLAYAISQNISSSKFKSMTAEEAQKWLQSSTSEAGIKFRSFIARHGHRCLKEFDIHSVPWGTDTKPLIKLLQSLAGSCDKVKHKTDDDFSKILSELQVPLGFTSRLLLRFLLPNCRRAVGEREASKSILIRGMDAWRKAYQRLSQLLVAEGYIPDANLMYFFTLEELDDLMRSRNPSLLSKAKHRRRIFPELDKYVFPEIMKGVPQPENHDDDPVPEYDADLVMKGIPVSKGTARGFARVALTLQEASHLKSGEILVTYSTDIGWSPYFPILAGVVTELGGLISHGAVVSREYGLPCVVGLHGATRQFRTGDYVLLDGNRGTLQRLPMPVSHTEI